MRAEDHLEPTGANVLVSIDPQAGTVGSIVIPDRAAKAPHSVGTVLKAGPLAAERFPAGMVVVFRTSTPMKLGLDAERGHPVGIFHADEVLATIAELEGDDAAALAS